MTGYEGRHARLGSGNGNGTLRYVHLGTAQNPHSGPSNLRGWRIRHENADGSEAETGQRVHRTVVTDEAGRDYLWEQHESRTDGDGRSMAVGRIGTMLPSGPGRPRAGSERVDFAAPRDMAAWLQSRSARLIAGGEAPSMSQQAKTEIALHKVLLGASLAEVAPLTLGQARALAEVTGGETMSAALAAAGDRPLLWQEAAVAFADARAPAAGGKLPAHPDDSYGTRHGIDEEETLALLAGLTVAQDAALRDALSRWWAEVYPRDGLQWRDGGEWDAASPEGFAMAGLRITG